MFSRIQSANTTTDLTPFNTDTGIKTEESSWTKQFRKKYPGIGGDIRNIARVTKIPYTILKKVYDRGMKAYLTGHRPGATKYQWAYARLYSFIIRKKWKSLPHDKDLL